MEIKISVKNMVCNRCVLVVKQILKDLEISYKSVVLGEIYLEKTLTEDVYLKLNTQLKSCDFEILRSQEEQLIAMVKTKIIREVSRLDIPEGFLLSSFIQSSFHREYTTISKLFSQKENMTLEQFFILQKVEKVKELLSYNEYSLSQIACMLGYKTVQHLSAQFKNITGFAPSVFKKLKQKNRKSLDSII